MRYDIPNANPARTIRIDDRLRSSPQQQGWVPPGVIFFVL